MTTQIAGVDKDVPHSDPGIYICSTDMILLLQPQGILKHNIILYG
jgi:hypothetical protein